MVGKKYNLNALKEIMVQESFLTLDKDVRGCQDDESLSDCTTTNYLKALLNICGCYPLHLKMKSKVFCMDDF